MTCHVSLAGVVVAKELLLPQAVRLLVLGMMAVEVSDTRVTVAV